MKICFLNPPLHGSRSGGLGQPLGLLSVASQLTDHSVTILDCNLDYGAPFYTLDEALYDGYDALCVTMNTPTAPIALEIIKIIKQRRPNIRTIVGGVHATIYADYISKLTFVDSVVTGEGEHAVGRALHSNGVISGGTVDLKTIKPPDWRLLPLKRYTSSLVNGKFAMVMTSRGCPFNCIFCSAHIICGRKIRYVEDEKLRRELHQLVSLKVKHIIFQDDIFTLGLEERGILDELRLLRRMHHVDWWCNTRVDLISMDVLKKMRPSGCVGVCLGIESGNQEILNAMNKNVSLSQIRTGVKMVHDAGLKTYGYFMIGNLDDTEDTVKQTVDLALELPLDYAQFSICTPFPGSELYTIARERGVVTDDFDWDIYDWEREPPNVSKLTDKARREWYRKATRSFYFRPSKIIKHLNVKDIKTGLRLLR